MINFMLMKVLQTHKSFVVNFVPFFAVCNAIIVQGDFDGKKTSYYFILEYGIKRKVCGHRFMPS